MKKLKKLLPEIAIFEFSDDLEPVFPPIPPIDSTKIGIVPLSMKDFFDSEGHYKAFSHGLAKRHKNSKRNAVFNGNLHPIYPLQKIFEELCAVFPKVYDLEKKRLTDRKYKQQKTLSSNLPNNETE